MTTTTITIGSISGSTTMQVGMTICDGVSYNQANNGQIAVVTAVWMTSAGVVMTDLEYRDGHLCCVPAAELEDRVV